MSGRTVVALVALAVGLALGAAGMRLADRTWPAKPADTGAAVVAPAQGGGAGKKGNPRVEVVPVEQQAVPRGISAVGSLRSEDAVVLRAEVAGRITDINFKEGGHVAKGQVLVRLDDSVARAELKQAQANLRLASSQYQRARQLAEQGFISKQARDEAASQFGVQEAAVALARARLEKTVIIAPFDGLIGLRNVSVGDYINAGSDLAPLESVDPLKVDFRIPEQYFADVRVGQKLNLSFDALPGQAREGVVGAISPLVDVGGRSLLLRATVPNTDGALRPGMFARVQLEFSDSLALVVPETALSPSGESQYVYRVADGRAERIEVRVGSRRQGKVEIIGRIKAGDKVVVSGLQKIVDGREVDIATPAASAPAS
ncbi:efflux RND transporter periplasmic adaptor subunit [Pusillimonas sp. TS35]|uniref:efflux RND transporter periplasmic adaptor subunit n=1 Tax=Paracandidimonas lactea TaxID=2895524 RepID=UPI00136DE3BD|nr:efflux RND transporter periplasmic adaptor subunit [Paracandidimonas lactea]MYN14141.1 efflux RND transporter periplasmic adaptor subunit [Pusillimonas sp. TS35]